MEDNPFHMPAGLVFLKFWDTRFLDNIRALHQKNCTIWKVRVCMTSTLGGELLCMAGFESNWCTLSVMSILWVFLKFWDGV